MTSLTEIWRVSDDSYTAVAHLIVYQRDGVRATACNWVPSRPGILRTRAEVLAGHRFCCVRCARAAVAR